MSIAEPVLGHCDAALEADRQHQVDRQRLGHRFWQRQL
jgi:hypothetical protein